MPIAEHDIGRIADKMAIHEALMRYCRGIDRLDFSLIASAFHPDAFADYGAWFKGNPLVHFSTYVMPEAGASLEASQHQVTNYLIDLDGDAAQVEAYWIAWSVRRQPDGSRRRTVMGGRYEDHFERRDRDWRIADRLVIWDWNSVDSVTSRDDGVATLWGRPGPDDASYGRLYRLQDSRPT
jgi:hypothetical protein